MMATASKADEVDNTILVRRNALTVIVNDLGPHWTNALSCTV